MANDTAALTRSRRRKDDEFYTLYEDIADELTNYREQFRGKRVICPCDWDESLDEVCVYSSEEETPGGTVFASGTVKTVDAARSAWHMEKDVRLIKCNFVRFLVSHAEDWGIASISVSGYDPATMRGVRFQDLDYSKYDICVTNPPFSQFSEFVETMIANGLGFVAVGPQHAPTLGPVYRRFRDDEMWMGHHYHMGGFLRPDGTRIPGNDNLARSCCWYTNMDVSYRNSPLQLAEEYSPGRYPMCDNFRAIYVERTQQIPYDWDGPMLVPITFLQKYCPSQFRILGLTDGTRMLRDLEVPGRERYDRPYVGGRRKFPRLAIRRAGR